MKNPAKTSPDGPLALTVRQPWAWAILHLGKGIENRTWSTTYRGTLVIHAGHGIDQAALTEARAAGLHPPRSLPTSAVLGTVRLIGVHRARTCRCSEWAETGTDLYHWVLLDPTPVPRPIPCRGALRLWRPPTAVLTQLGPVGR